jgi:hypothetical protein
MPASGFDASELDEYPLDLVVTDLHRVADAAGLGDFVLAGYSGTAAYAAFLAPVSDRAVGLVAGGFPVLGPHDYWLEVLESSGSPAAHTSILLYRAWAERDDRPALAALPGPKLVYYGTGDGEPGCAMHAAMPGAAIARTLAAQSPELQNLGFNVVPLEALDHLGTQAAVDVVAPIIAASIKEKSGHSGDHSAQTCP